MNNLIEFFRFMALCAKAYRFLRTGGVHYIEAARFGVPTLTMLVARDRDAWVVTQLAIEHRLTRGLWKTGAPV